ncbi:hypothetical protein [Hymenobacter jeollabukensis]|uniref:Outer membrane protein beta-barrel domain-containing protein n=1 Tax=Hymenobacter jeollabukensis TaxID=2025313 RepID=A0A5R8WTT2_9BACT|nr:hypothetical protein [Hymenobacter jeollabukensis]TLM95182.1 hypothetical protein FDY95_05165 [Hymenobacter jeollabukensis]
MKTTLLALLLAALAWSQPAAAQRGARCVPYAAVYPWVYVAGSHHACPDTVDRPFVPSRWGLFFGLSALSSPRTGFGGAEVAGSYRVGPRLQASLAGTVAIPMRIGSSLGVADVRKPMLGLYSLSARANAFLVDNARFRAGLLGGLGAGVATLADRSQQVTERGQQSCGCEPETHAKTVATSVGLVGLAGAAATYKLRPDLWLTAHAYYQQWAGATRFGRQADLSPWVLSVGLTMPDAWRAAR